LTSLPADTKEACGRKVALYESQGETSVFIYAEINREDELTLSEQDVGKTPEEFLGAPDYEYCIVISKEHKDRLRCALMEREFWEDVPWHSIWKTLFPLFTTVFEDLAISAEDFRQFLRLKGIPFEEPGTIDAHHNDDVLIALMERAFGGNPGAGRHFHEFLESNKISFGLFDGHRSSGSPRTATEILGRHFMELTPAAFRTGNVYLDYPYEDAKFRWEKQTGKVYRRFYGKRETEIDHTSDIFNEAFAAGELITRDEYFVDYPTCKAVGAVKRLFRFLRP